MASSAIAVLATASAYVAGWVLPQYGLLPDFLGDVPFDTKVYVGAASKAIPIIFLGLIALAGAARAKSASVKTYAQYIAYGLFLGCIGDIFLDVEQVKPVAFLPGLVAFLLGHIWYIVGFAATPRRHKLWLVVPLVVYPLAILGYLYPHLVKGNDDMRGAVLVYGGVISTMTYFAAVRSGVPATNYWLTLGGALSFVVSDSVLAVNKFAFDNTLPYAKVIVMVTYYGAQALTGLAVKSLVDADIAAAKAAAAAAAPEKADAAAAGKKEDKKRK